jgi:beta-1,4-N-acetylglucosaminyltransferase
MADLVKGGHMADSQRGMEENQIRAKICIVSSIGGHLGEARALRKVYERYDHFFVLNAPTILPKELEGKTTFICHSERDWRFFVNLWEAWRILREKKPDLIMSPGAGPAVPFALVGKLLRIPFLFIETSSHVTVPSLTGRIMYYLADRFFYEWKSMGKFFPKGIYGGLNI